MSSVARTLLSLPPFNRLPLHVRFFEPKPQHIFTSLVLPHPLPLSVTLVLDTSGPSGVDVSDTEHRTLAVDTWPDHEDDCALCDSAVGGTGIAVDAGGACQAYMCPDCLVTTHIACLAPHFLGESERVVPTSGRCPRCDRQVEWGEVVRARYAVLEAPR